MKFRLLINYGDATTPQDPDAWGRLSHQEQRAVYAGYQAVNQTRSARWCRSRASGPLLRR